MKLTCIIAALMGLVLTVSGQKIALKQTASANDIKVVSGDYTLHFKTADLVAAISKIDSVNKSDNTALITSLKENKIKSVTLPNGGPSDKAFVDLLKSNLGCYLIARGKVAVTKAGKPVTEIMADESPEIVELDGSSRIHIAFKEGNDEASVFHGQLATKLKPGK